MKKKKLLFGATAVATTIATEVTAQADSVNGQCDCKCSSS